MSSYAELLMGSLSLGSTRNDIDSGLIWLFRPSDKRVERINWRDRGRLSQHVSEEYLNDYNENNQFTLIQYKCTAAVARDRLEIKGFTLDVAKARFQASLQSHIRKLREFSVRTDVFENRIQLLESLTLKDWLTAFARIREQGLTAESLDEIPSAESQLPLLRYMLSESRDYFGYPGFDFRHFVRLIIEVVPLHEEIIYDLSDLVGGGWVDDADDLITLAESLIDEDFLLAHRVIVLTEGDTDKRFLQRSLNLLYPHLADYFHFFDFTGKKVAGGAGELANLVRAFAAADVRHRILALFDNDTGAESSLSNLDISQLPKNIVVRQYPYTRLAQNYPTIGPSGSACMDVNGLAGSLELYLGEDVLRSTGQDLSPVQWRGYDHKLCRYHGEVLNKDRIQEEFERKLNRCEAHPEDIDAYDWEGIKAIINVMLTAFQEVDVERIFSGAIYE